MIICYTRACSSVISPDFRQSARIFSAFARIQRPARSTQRLQGRSRRPAAIFRIERQSLVGSRFIAFHCEPSTCALKASQMNVCTTSAQQLSQNQHLQLGKLNSRRMNTCRKNGAPPGRAKVYPQDELLRVKKGRGWGTYRYVAIRPSIGHPERQAGARDLSGAFHGSRGPAAIPPAHLVSYSAGRRSTCRTAIFSKLKTIAPQIAGANPWT